MTPASRLARLGDGYVVTQLLWVAAELRIADVLAGGPRTARELATQVGADRDVLRRVLRGRVGLTTTGQLLREGCEGSQGGAVITRGRLYYGALAGLLGILNRYGSVDEIDLHGHGCRPRLLPWLMLLAGLALAGLPPFGTGLGKAVAEEAAAKAGAPWAPALFVIVSALTGAAVLRVAARIYFGAGRRPRAVPGEPDTSGSVEEPEVEGLLRRVPLTMLTPIVVLLLAGLALGVAPGVPRAFAAAADLFVDGEGYVSAVLGTPAAAVVPSPPHGWTATGAALGLLSALLAVLIALAALYRDRLPVDPAEAARRLVPALAGLRALHSGHVGDYIAWLVVGVAVLGGLVALPGP